MEVKGYVLAPKATIKNKLSIRYMYRETPDNVYDSVWRIFSGDETDEYVNDPKNIGVYDILTIANMYPYISPYLKFPFGSALERKGERFAFSIVDEYS